MSYFECEHCTDMFSRQKDAVSDSESDNEVCLKYFSTALEISQPRQDAESGMNRKDEELACLRGKLEKRWGNDSDSSYAYLDPITGQRYPLTLFMMDEWVRGMVCPVRYDPALFLMIL
jgi:hypothetical protein